MSALSFTTIDNRRTSNNFTLATKIGKKYVPLKDFRLMVDNAANVLSTPGVVLYS
jgi:hypothetical protein